MRWSRHEIGEELAARSTAFAGSGDALPNLSILVGSTAGGAREKHQLYVQGRLFVVTAHDGRLFRAVVRALAGLSVGPPDPETVRLDALLIVDAEGRATLVDRSLERDLRHLEPRLRRRGWNFVDTPVVPVSVAEDSTITLPDAYATVGVGREPFLERWPLLPGDDAAGDLVVPVRRIIYASSEEPQSRAEATAHLARSLAPPDHTGVGHDVARLAELTASVPTAPSAPDDRAALMQTLNRP